MAHPILVDVSRQVVLKEIPITSDKFSLGRGLHNGFVVEDVNVSRTHCMLQRSNDEWTIWDKSSNGTWLNGQLLDQSKSHKLSTGDVIGLSESLKFVFKMPFNTSSRAVGKSTKKTLSEDDILNIAESVIADVEAFQAEYESEKFDETIFNNATPNNLQASNSNQQSTSSSGINPANIINVNGALQTIYVVRPINTGQPNNIQLQEVNIEQVPQSNVVELVSESNPALPLPWDIHSSSSVEQPSEGQKPNDQLQANNLEYVEDELQCSICTEMFVQAVTLSCSHTFCKYCITQWQKNQAFCPICRDKITMQFPTRVVDNFIEKVIEKSSEEIKQHRRELIEQRQTVPAAPTASSSNSNGRRRPAQDPIEISSSEENTSDEDGYEDMSDYSGSDWERDYDNDDYYDDDYNGLPGNYYGGYGHCYACGQRGHWANGCPNKRR